MTRFLPYGRQCIDEEDIAAVTEALKSDYLTTGPRIAEFERGLAAAVGAEHAVVVTNGTAALHAACAAADIGPGDEVLVPAITFVASANCVRYMGGEPIFVDVEPDTGLIDPDLIASAVTGRTKAILPVHMTGRPVDLAAVREVADAKGLLVIEDAAHALGARYDGKAVGSGAFAELATFSFHPVKHVTTAEGGAITTESAALAHTLRQFRDHGMERQPERFQRPSPGPWYHEQHTLGHNLRLSDLHCALGISQLRKLDRFLNRRRELAARYDRLLEGLPRIRPLARGPQGAESAYHLYVVLIDFKALRKSRAAVMHGLRERAVGTQVHYIPVPSQPYYSSRGWAMSRFPGAQKYYERALSIPLFPTMTDEDQDRVVQALAEVIGGD